MSIARAGLTCSISVETESLLQFFPFNGIYKRGVELILKERLTVSGYWCRGKPDKRS